jgi:hypothetical protein
MFFQSARRDEYNGAIHSSIWECWNITKSGLASFGNRVGRFQLCQPRHVVFFVWALNEMIQICFRTTETWWRSLYALWTIFCVNISPYFFSKACVLKHLQSQNWLIVVVIFKISATPSICSFELIESNVLSFFHRLIVQA